jgi:hypothetical protein
MYLCVDLIENVEFMYVVIIVVNQIKWKKVFIFNLQVCVLPTGCKVLITYFSVN